MSELIDIMLPLLICVAVCLLFLCVATGLVCVAFRMSIKELNDRVERLEEDIPEAPFGDFTEQGGKP